jgi:hypothetical protein
MTTTVRYETIDCEQGSAEWYAARMGIPTASRFADVLAQGKGLMRAKYLNQLAGEIITGEPMENYTNEKMDRGKTHEPELRARYEFGNDVDIERIGFVKMNPELCAVGCSPDGWVGAMGMVEFKSAEPHILIPMLRSGMAPAEHKAQVQGNLWISGRKWCDLVIGWPKLPLAISRVPRDEAYIGGLSVALKAFNVELNAIVEQIRGML